MADLSRSQALNWWEAERNDKRAPILVESVRVDGEPRQKHVAFLGSMTSDSLGHPGPRFW
jgi:hypothetical protein